MIKITSLTGLSNDVKVYLIDETGKEIGELDYLNSVKINIESDVSVTAEIKFSRVQLENFYSETDPIFFVPKVNPMNMKDHPTGNGIYFFRPEEEEFCVQTVKVSQWNTNMPVVRFLDTGREEDLNIVRGRWKKIADSKEV